MTYNTNDTILKGQPDSKPTFTTNLKPGGGGTAPVTIGTYTVTGKTATDSCFYVTDRDHLGDVVAQLLNLSCEIVEVKKTV